MALSRNEAVEMLGEISRTEQRSAELREYAFSSPHFVLWGVAWVIGYTGSYLLPNYGFVGAINWLWFAITIAGVTGSHVITRRQIRDRNPDQQAVGRAKALRIGMTWLAVWFFVVATFFVMKPVNPMAAGAWIPLIVALLYAIVGIWKGVRFLYAGIAVAVLTLGGWLYLREFFLLWMAFVGGGALMLAGLWLKKA
jgi:hypothetical protein